ncbi:hypothetical protein ACRQ5Q_14810 [Bradyrhizobium sp. PMVTL-01]|uniref:hypothetical protein n=1 Tax=Bradyrhizobium sp. PMVTL-01 TaxID=3434999 RepID=UPI003F709EA7
MAQTQREMLEDVRKREIAALDRLRTDRFFFRSGEYQSAVAWREMRIANVDHHLRQLDQPTG